MAAEPRPAVPRPPLVPVEGGVAVELGEADPPAPPSPDPPAPPWAVPEGQ